MSDVFRVSDIKNFVEVSRCGSLTRGALELGIKVSSLSESILRLESDLGERVFYRSRSGVTLTPTGRKVLESSLKMIEAMKTVASVTRKGADESPVRLILGAHPLVASYCLPKVMKDLVTEAPNVCVELRHGVSREMQSLVQRGLIDIALVVNPVLSNDLVVQELCKDEVGVWKVKTPNSVPNHLLCDPGLFQTQAVLRRWKEAPITRTESDSLELLARLTASGQGYGVLPEKLVHLLGLDLERAPQTPLVEDRICLVRRPEFGRGARERLLIELIQRSFAA